MLATRRTELQQSIVDLLRKRGNRLLAIKEIADRLDDDVSRDEIGRASCRERV